MSYSVFVSYRSEDSGGHAGYLYDELARAIGSARVFLDADHVHAMRRFREQILSAIDECQLFVLVMGRTFVSERLFEPEDVLRSEVEFALNKNKRILPVLVDDASMPAATSLPQSIRSITEFQALNLRTRDRRDYHNDVTKLINDVVLLWNGTAKEISGQMKARFATGLSTRGILDYRRARLLFSRDTSLAGWGTAPELSIYIDGDAWPLDTVACGTTIDLDILSGRHEIWLYTMDHSWNPRTGNTSEVHQSNHITQVFEPGIYSLRVRHRFFMGFIGGATDGLELTSYTKWDQELA